VKVKVVLPAPPAEARPTEVPEKAGPPPKVERGPLVQIDQLVEV
jgi:hypothetical protein